MSYCTAIATMEPSEKKTLHQSYHDTHYGFPIHDDNELFGRLLMEINQAGLSWETILKKETTFRKAYSNFSIEKIAAYTAMDRARLLSDPGVIRNKLKVNAAIENAKTVLELQKEYGSFQGWIEHHHPKPLAEWVRLFRKTFRFTGGEIVNEFLMSIGVLEGAHDKNCPIQEKIIGHAPLWMQMVYIPNDDD